MGYRPTTSSKCWRAPDLTESPPVGALFRAQSEFDQTFSATVDGDDAVAAGVAVYTNSVHFFSALVRPVGSGRVVSYRRVVDDMLTEAETVVPAQGDLRLTVTATGGRYTFTATVGHESWELDSGNSRLLSAEAAQWFVNVNFALVAVDEGSNGGTARFGRVLIEEPLKTVPPAFEIPY